MPDSQASPVKRPAANITGSHSSVPDDVQNHGHSPSRGRPAHFRTVFALAVFCGGVLGTLARYGLSMMIPAPNGWPLPTLLINITGAFLLGMLLEALVRRGPDEGILRLIRLSAGTGFMGAFTTYSALALESVHLAAEQAYLGMALYLMLSLFGGVLASAAGIRAASSCHHRKTRRQSGTGRRNL